MFSPGHGVSVARPPGSGCAIMPSYPLVGIPPVGPAVRWNAMRRTISLAVALAATITLGAAELTAQRSSERRVANPGETQFDVQLLRSAGGPVVPIFEGWYRNPDGTFELSFGYFNVNTEETLEIPLGPDNVIEPLRVRRAPADAVRAGPRERPAALGRLHRDGAGGLRQPRRGLDAARAGADALGAGAVDQPRLRAGRVGVSGTVERVAAAAVGA